MTDAIKSCAMSDCWAESLQVGAVSAVIQELGGVLGLQAQRCLSLGNTLGPLRKQGEPVRKVETVNSLYSFRFIESLDTQARVLDPK